MEYKHKRYAYCRLAHLRVRYNIKSGQAGWAVVRPGRMQGQKERPSLQTTKTTQYRHKAPAEQIMLLAKTNYTYTSCKRTRQAGVSTRARADSMSGPISGHCPVVEFPPLGVHGERDAAELLLTLNNVLCLLSLHRGRGEIGGSRAVADCCFCVGPGSTPGCGQKTGFAGDCSSCCVVKSAKSSNCSSNNPTSVRNT